MAKKKETLKREAPKKEALLPVKWNIPDTVITRFASNMVVQNIEGYFKLTFFELKPEIHLTAPTTSQTEIVADCVASVVVPPEKLPAIIDVLTKQLLQFQQKIQDQLKAVSSSEPARLS